MDRTILDDLVDEDVEETKPFNPYDEWKNMPEFVQEKQEPFAKIIVRFETEEDLLDFSKRIGQSLNKKTKSIWHPKLQRGINGDKRYIDEGQIYTYEP